MNSTSPADERIKNRTEADTAASGVRPSLKTKYLNTVEARDTRQLSNIVINGCLKALRLNLSTASIIYAALFLAVLIWIVTTVISIAVDGAAPAFASSALASLLTGLSFGIIKYLDHHLISSRQTSFPKNLADYALDDDALKALVRWHHCFLSLKAQLATSGFFAILGLTSAIYMAKSMALDFKLGSYFLVFCCSFGVGHGAYCTFVIPTLTRVVAKRRMKVFWLNPGDTEWINDASEFFTKLTIADSLIFALCLLSLYLLKPWHAPGTMRLALAWLLIGIVSLSYIFLFSHYHLNQCIKREKKAKLRLMQNKILSYNQPGSKLNEAQLEEFVGHVNVYKELSNARESAIDLQKLSQVLSSVSVLVLTYLGPFLLEVTGIKRR